MTWHDENEDRIQQKNMAEKADRGKSMITVGIAIDDWKLKIFKKRLDENEYKYTEHDGPKHTLILKVETESAAKLQLLVESVNAEAAKSRSH